MTAKLYLFPLERVRPDLKKGKGSYNYLKALQKALSPGNEKKAWDILRKKKW